MNITVPFLYEAMIVKKRCRKPVVVSVLDSVDVEIRELTAEQMPVAMRVGEQELRWDGHELWDFSYQVVRRQAEKVSARTLLETTKNSGSYTYHCATAEAPFARFWRFERDSMAERHGINMCCLLDRLDEVDFMSREAVECREWVDDNRQAMIDKAHAIAASRVIIDGYVLVPVGEPRYQVNTFGLGNNHGGTGMFVTQYYNSNIPHHRYFSALNYAEACEYADAVATKRGDDRSVPVRPNGGHTIDVLIPEAVRVDPASQHGDGCEFINSIESGINAGGPVGGLVAAVSQLAG